MDRMWILLGMMGAGKSSVGRALSELSGRSFLDTDILLQNRFGRPVSQIFQVYGEETFRQHETSILRSLEPQRAVLATGGGIVMRPENWDELRRLGTTIFLRVPPELLEERLAQSKKRRPLLETENWQARVHEILSRRMPLYEQADLTVDMEGCDVQGAAERIYQALKDHS